MEEAEGPWLGCGSLLIHGTRGGRAELPNPNRAEGEAGREPVSEEPEKLSVWYRNNVLSEILHSPEYLKLRAV